MAEATLFVSATKRENEAKVVHVDREELNAGRFAFVDADAPVRSPWVSCGQVARDQWATIVDADTATELPDAQIGGSGCTAPTSAPATGVRDDETRETFDNRLVTRLAEGSHADGVPDDAKWMRTGDYGVWVDGELYITGRVRDLVIVDGRNHYPQDLEFTAQETSTALRPGFVSAFAVPVNQLPTEVVFRVRGERLTYDPDDASGNW